MQKFSYTGMVRLGIIFSQISGIVGLIFSTGMAVLLLWGTTKTHSNNLDLDLLNDPKVTLICVGVYSIVIGWGVSFALINSAPTIWITDEGLFISAYIFFRIKIVWPDILIVREHKIGPFVTGHSLVFARRISLFHRIFGSMYNQGFLPGFIIRKEIEDYDLLLRILRRKTLLT